MCLPTHKGVRVKDKIINSLKLTGIILLSALSAAWVTNRDNDARFTYEKCEPKRIEMEEFRK